MTQRETRAASTNGHLLQVRDLKKWFPVQQGWLDQVLTGRSDHVRAVDGVSFDIRKGEVFGLAGESGSGKSTIGRSVLRLTEPTAGTVRFDGIDMSTLGPTELRRLRRRMQVIFQDPMASLNPRMTIGASVVHGLQIHYPERAAEHRELTAQMLERVGLAPAQFYLEKFPHQISGGQRQRVVIARALVTRPDLVLADEPIAMADVSVRALLLDSRGSWAMVLSNGTEVVVGSQQARTRMARFARLLPQLLHQKQRPLSRADLRYTNGFALTWAEESNA